MKAVLFDLDGRGYEWKGIVYERIIDEFPIGGISLDDLLKDYVANFQYYCVPFSNLISMLEYLKITNIKYAFTLI